MRETTIIPKRQTSREAGTQSLRASISEVAGFPKDKEMKKKLYITTILSLATLTVSSTAMAEANGLFTLGLGASYSVTKIQDLNDSNATETMSPSLSVRLKLLRIFGAELEYSPTVAQKESTDLVMDSAYRASGLLFLLPTQYFGVYGKAGVGSHDLAQLANPMGETSSFHAGGGFDIHLGDHLALGGELLVLLPGAHSIDTALSKHGLRSTNENLGSGVSASPRSPVELQMSDLINTDNYQASVSLRYYF